MSALRALHFVLFVVKREVSCGHFVALLDSRDFKQQLRMERQQRPEVCRHTAVAKNVKVSKAEQRNAALIHLLRSKKIYNLKKQEKDCFWR